MRGYWLVPLAVVLTLGGGCGKKVAQTKPQTALVLSAAYSERAPKIDGVNNESVWRKARLLEIPTKNGPVVSMKAVSTDKMIYFSASWPDADKDLLYHPWEFDGTGWKRGPSDDGLAIFWNIENSIRGFNKTGCQAVCHPGKEPGPTMRIVGPATPSGLWEGCRQRGDVWWWSAGISDPAGQIIAYPFAINDMYVKAPSATLPRIFLHKGYHGSNEPWVSNWQVASGGEPTGPIYQLRRGLTAEDTPLPSLDQVEPIADNSVFRLGDRIPSILVRQAGPWWSENDLIESRSRWRNGVWMVEFGRKLDTGRTEFVQFERELPGLYVFALAVYDKDGANRHHVSAPVTLQITEEEGVVGAR